MRKNLIALSVAAFVGGLGMTGSATASVIAGAATADTETVRQSGTGHQLIVPYFNTQVGNATLINIVNTDVTNGKAVKVRFRGASNSDDVFDFQVYLSPGDVWTANISKGPNGMSRLTTVDKSCTLPAGVGAGAGTDFVTARLPSTLTGDDLNTQTREGYVEMFNMADVPPILGGVANPLFTAIKHINGVPPCGGGGTSAQQTAATAAMLALQQDPTVIGVSGGGVVGAQTLGLYNPGTGLMANWMIVNVPKSGSATGEAVAITATVVASRLPGLGNIVFFPQIGGNAPTPNFFTSDASFRTVGVVDLNNVAYLGLPILTAQFFDLPDLSTPYITPYLGTLATDPGNYVTILQQALATTSITNEFLTDTTINAFTDWTFSSPTRRYSAVVDYRPLASALPATAAYISANPYYQGTNTSMSGFQLCTKTGAGGVSFYDREEGNYVGNSFVISPNPPAPSFKLCGEVSVLTFNSTGASVLGAAIARTNFTTTIPSGVVRDGWATVGTPGATAIEGLPIIGKSFSSATTGTFNLGGSWEHRYTPAHP